MVCCYIATQTLEMHRTPDGGAFVVFQLSTAAAMCIGMFVANETFFANKIKM